MLSKTLGWHLPMSNINEIPQGFWWYSYINLNTKNFDFFMKILSLWPWPQGHTRGGDGADKNFRPIFTIMPNMNEIHQRVFKIWGLINFNAKTLTLWRKDKRTYIRTNERKGENYIPPHWLCWGLTTRQPLWVILCRLPEKGRKETEEIAEEMKERTGKKEEQEWKWRNRRNKNITSLPLPATRIAGLAQL